MNSYLNIFKTYAKENRQHQLENDLTRALGICLQEDNLFFHEVLKRILGNSKYYNQMFEDPEGETNIRINIQQPTSQIEGFSHLFAVSLSEHVMDETTFWEQSNHAEYNPICDLVIQINEVVIIVEAKRDNVDCTAQLYNQAHNIMVQNEIPEEDRKAVITPVDLNWPKLMDLTVKVFGVEKATGNPSRFVDDFIKLIRDHNFRWLPEPSIGSLLAPRKPSIRRRIESALKEVVKTSDLSSLANRLGFDFPHSWANEVLFDIDNEGGLGISIYPGNTKGQGRGLFHKEPQFQSFLEIRGERYDLDIMRHIKLSSFSSYFTGLWFYEDKLETELYTSENFGQYTGRNKIGEDWDTLAALFDRHFKKDFDWREECSWEQKVIHSNRTQFDISFGYEISITIPFSTLQEIDTQKSDLAPLVNLLQSAHQAFADQLLLP